MAPSLQIQLLEVIKRIISGHVDGFGNRRVHKGLNRFHHGDVVLGRHFQRRHKALGQFVGLAPKLVEQAPSVVLHGVLTRAAIGLAFFARVGPRKRRLDAVGSVVGKSQAHRARGGDGDEVAVADAVLADLGLQGLGQTAGKRALGQITFDVEEREGAFFLRQSHRGFVGGVAHALGDLRGHLATGFAVVLQVQQSQGVAQAGEAHADAALVGGFLLLLGQRPPGHVEHVVEHAHLRAHGFFKSGEVEFGGATETKGVAHKTRQDDRAQIAATVGRQGLLAAVVHHQAIGVKGVNIIDRHVKHRLLTTRHQRLDRHGKALAVE